MTRGDLIRVFLRSLAFQGSWSFRGMQSLGFAYAMDPALRRIHEGGDPYRKAIKRHLEFFNTHPFLAAAVLGCSVRLEAEGAEDSVGRVKEALMGPCGAMGDSLFWGALKPLFVLVAVWTAHLGVLWAPLLLVGGFGICNLGFRAAVFRWGYREGVGVVEGLARANLIGWARRMKAIAAVGVGVVLVAAYGATPAARWGVPEALWVTVAGVAAVALALAVERGVRPEWMVYGSALLAGGLAVLS